MGYSTGLLKYRVEILKRVMEDGKIGRNSGKTSYEVQTCVWADMTWKRGQKALNDGAFDAIDTVLFRMRFNPVVNRESFLRHDGVIYQIQSFHADKQENTIQITAIETVAQ